VGGKAESRKRLKQKLPCAQDWKVRPVRCHPWVTGAGLPDLRVQASLGPLKKPFHYMYAAHRLPKQITAARMEICAHARVPRTSNHSPSLLVYSAQFDCHAFKLFTECAPSLYRSYYSYSPIWSLSCSFDRLDTLHPTITRTRYSPFHIFHAHSPLDSDCEWPKGHLVLAWFISTFFWCCIPSLIPYYTRHVGTRASTVVGYKPSSWG